MVEGGRGRTGQTKSGRLRGQESTVRSQWRSVSGDDRVDGT